jgi:Dyp-type peroxidase family
MTDKFKWPDEPVLDMQDIQGIAVPGFFKPYQVILGVRYDRAPYRIKALLGFLRELAPNVSSAEATLRDRREHRLSAAKSTTGRDPLIAIGFSFQGLFGLTPGADAIPSLAYKNGLARRSAMLGDPTDPKNPGHPDHWLVGGPHNELDILIVIAGDTRKAVVALAGELKKSLTAAKAKVIAQPGGVRDDVPGGKGHEHFGFDDGVSQPGIRGRASNGAKDFITPRHVDRSEYPAAAMFGYPGQDLVWPGEFVIGYPQTGPDPLIPGPIFEPTPAWTRNGSFLVYRRLRQDVGLFWRTMRSEAQRLSALSAFADLKDVELAAKLVGRWLSGAPVSRTPAKDDAKLGEDKLANNHFRFDCDTPKLKVVHGIDNFPQAKADPIGAACPLAAHIRKVNTRDAPSDTGGRSSTYERRLLRVGVPYGPSAKDRYANSKPGDPDRGLLFLSIQSSIEEQFEFLQARWMNDQNRPKAPSGNDMIVGQNAPTDDGTRRCTLFGSGLTQAQVQADEQFVIPTGGGYFFIPSRSALSTVIAPPAATPGGKKMAGKMKREPSRSKSLSRPNSLRPTAAAGKI